MTDADAKSSDQPLDLPGSAKQWVELCAVEAVPAEGGLYAECNGRAYAVFRKPEGQFFVIDDACPHAGASLSAGHVDQGCVVCSWHAWPFDLATGKCPDNPAIAVSTYRLKTESGKILIQLK